MYFTREPLIETVVTPREGYKLVVRSSRSGSEQEEYFVDALEVVSFGQALFFRSMERPKSFLVPVSDYEVIEVRETRMILKAAPLERGVKIGGGRDAHIKPAKEGKEERLEDEEIAALEAGEEDEEEIEGEIHGGESQPGEGKVEKRRERRRHRRRKPRAGEKEESTGHVSSVDELSESYSEGEVERREVAAHQFASLIPPPPTLISETISMYRNNENFRKAFTEPEETKVLEESREEILPPPPPPFSDEL